MFTHSCHDFLKMTVAFAVAALLAGKCPATAFAQPEQPRPGGTVDVRVTAADKRYASVDPLHWGPLSDKPGTNAIVLRPDNKLQPILGFGASLTDSACYLISQMPEAAREELLQELFDQKQMGLSVCRLCIGSEGEATNVQHVAALNPDGQYAVVLTNSGRTPTTVQLHDGSSAVEVSLPADSVSTLTWR